MANHPQADSTAKGDTSDRSQAISGPSTELSSSIWLGMRNEKSGYLDAQPQRFALADSGVSANSSKASDAPLTIRTGVATDGASSNPNSLPNIDFFDSAAATSEKPQAGGIEASQAKPASSADNEKSATEMKWETYSPSYVGNPNGAFN